MNRLEQLHDAGVSIWLDTLSRELLDSGDFAALIADYAVTGATSNPTIFARAITGSDRYDEQLRAAAASGVEHVNGAVGAIGSIADSTAQAVVQVGVSAAAVTSQTVMIRQRVHAFTDDIRAMRA